MLHTDGKVSKCFFFLFKESIMCFTKCAWNTRAFFWRKKKNSYSHTRRGSAQGSGWEFLSSYFSLFFSHQMALFSSLLQSCSGTFCGRICFSPGSPVTPLYPAWSLCGWAVRPWLTVAVSRRTGKPNGKLVSRSEKSHWRMRAWILQSLIWLETRCSAVAFHSLRRHPLLSDMFRSIIWVRLRP